MNNITDLSNEMLITHFEDAVRDDYYNPQLQQYNQSVFSLDELRAEILKRLTKSLVLKERYDSYEDDIDFKNNIDQCLQ